jgi:hypothetical protein
MLDPRELRRYLDQRLHPIVCVGPMSRNCVTAAVRYADAIKRPIPLIASRRQVDAASLGGGYVEGWNTESFARFVRSIGGDHAVLCRDHGGPWQGSEEDGISSEEAMRRAKVSIAEDIAAGFGVIHLDPSIGEQTRDPAETLEMLFDLYAFSVETAERLGKNIEFEIGTEQQSGLVAGPSELIAMLKDVTKFCRSGGYQHPLFCVVQTGTLVREMRNVGLTEGRKNEDIDQAYAVKTMERNVRALADVAYINGVHIKEHNGDYLSDGSIATRAKWEIGGVNIAPEFGVLETRTLLSLSSELGLHDVRDAMLQIFYESMKWEKWLADSSEATELDKSVIAGHYSFADPAFLEQKSMLAHETVSRGFDLDEHIQAVMLGMLRRMTWCLGYHAGSVEGSIRAEASEVGNAIQAA